MFVLGKFIISDHAFKRYRERVSNPRYRNTYKSINHDLRTLNIRNIIYNKNVAREKIHVFTKNNVEFVFERGGNNKLYLKSIIQRNRRDTRVTINKRKEEAA